ncbi:MAG: DUF2232 domain-containing protein [Alphaproteobacteria bacterium]
MTQILLISIGAGLLSALLFASILTGSLIAIVMQIFAQLPLQTASLTFGPRASYIAAFAAIVALLFVSGLPSQTISFALNFATPALIASYLAGLKNTDIQEDDLAAWFPLGRILTVIAGASFVVFVLLSFYSGFTPEEAVTAIETQALILLEPTIESGQITLETINQLAVFFVALFPFVAAAGFVVVTTLNLVLAIRIARRYGTFKRPPSSIQSLEIPRIVHIIALASLAMIWTSGMSHPFLAAIAGASSTLVVFAGFAALHALTSRLSAQRIILFATYGSIILFTFPLLLILILGWIDGFLNLRGRSSDRASN